MTYYDDWYTDWLDEDMDELWDAEPYEEATQ